MLNFIWLSLIVLAALLGGLGGKIQAVTDGAVKGAETAVTLALGLIGVMSVWLGVMRLAEKSGLVGALARFLSPIMRRLFPDVPSEHPAMGSMVMNIAANMLGLTNAATPLGLRAMRDLESLNPSPGTATNAMCTFLAINTGSVQLIPMTAVAILASAGSRQPSAIIGTALLATTCSSVAGLVGVKLLERMRGFRLVEPSQRTGPRSTGADPNAEEETKLISAAGPNITALPPWGGWVLAVFGLAFVSCFLIHGFPEWFGRTMPPDQQGQHALVRAVNAVSLLAIPFLISFFPLYAALRRVQVYEEFVEGAKEGFQVAIRIIPFLVAMLTAIGMFRGAGGVDLLTAILRPALEWVQFPPELVPMALMRPLSGSGSLAIFTDLIRQYGPDSLLVRMAGTLYGSTETTFYVIAVYFGAVNVRRTRHAVPAGLIADAAGIIASIAICRVVFG